MFGRRRRGAAPSGPDYIFGVLRGQVLDLDPSSVGIAPTAGLPRVFGVVMDIAYEEATATVVALADGTTSLYLSTGGGIIGGGDHEAVASESRRLLRVAEAHVDALVDAGRPGLPRHGRVRLTVLTFDGPRSVEAPEDHLAEGRHPLSGMFHAVHAVISALREVDSGTPVDQPSDRDTDGVTPLMAAAHRGDHLLVRSLLGGGADPDAQDNVGYTALMYASNSGHDEVVRALIESGADTNTADRQVSTPLMFASQHDHLGIVRQLLAAGADPNARGDHGLTALGLAQQNGHDRTAAVLIAAGAN